MQATQYAELLQALRTSWQCICMHKKSIWLPSLSHKPVWIVRGGSHITIWQRLTSGLGWMWRVLTGWWWSVWVGQTPKNFPYQEAFQRWCTMKDRHQYHTLLAKDASHGNGDTAGPNSGTPCQQPWCSWSGGFATGLESCLELNWNLITLTKDLLRHTPCTDWVQI